ncbi:unnamed protein product [Ambrosiozyma monospora]|uniref:Unnamed protein product n=1 Tax=Ambrosiozyma monospora TaxID=43982 RepID=A0ACB5TZQ5_AMBMO|nr:unnamed protein product [Ambrosiozyma monospora]
MQTRFLMAQQLADPPNLFQSLSSLFTSQIVPYITFSQVAEEDESVDLLITPRTYYVLRLFEVIVSAEFESSDLVKMMVDYGIKNANLETYPLGIYLPLKNAIIYRKKIVNSSRNTSNEELDLIGRKDLLAFSDKSHSSHVPWSGRKIEHAASSQVKNMEQVLKNVDANEVMTAWDEQAEADKFHVTKLIFGEDRH